MICDSIRTHGWKWNVRTDLHLHDVDFWVPWCAISSGNWYNYHLMPPDSWWFGYMPLPRSFRGEFCLTWWRCLGYRGCRHWYVENNCPRSRDRERKRSLQRHLPFLQCHQRENHHHRCYNYFLSLFPQHLVSPHLFRFPFCPRWALLHTTRPVTGAVPIETWLYQLVVFALPFSSLLNVHKTFPLQTQSKANCAFVLKSSGSQLIIVNHPCPWIDIEHLITDHCILLFTRLANNPLSSKHPTSLRGKKLVILIKCVLHFNTVCKLW